MELITWLNARKARPKTIVIIGGSYAGLKVAHTLLKDVLTSGKAKDYKVVLITNSGSLYSNTCSIRAIVPHIEEDDHRLYKTGELFWPISTRCENKGFKVYPEGSFYHVTGVAVDLDPIAKTVSIKREGPSKGEMDHDKDDFCREYDFLVIATGTRPIDSSMPWKLDLEYNWGNSRTWAIVNNLRWELSQAKTIVIGGGGITGVELAAELACRHGKFKQINLIHAGKQLLGENAPLKVAEFAETELRKWKVHIFKGVKVVQVLKTNPTEIEEGKFTHKYELTLDDGSTQVVDMYLSTTGMLPNSEWIPKSLLNGNGYVVVDDSLRVKGFEDLFAAGDITGIELPQIKHAAKQAVTVAKNLGLAIKGKKPVVYKKHENPLIQISLGRDKGTGYMGNMQLPSWLVFKSLFLGLPDLSKVAWNSDWEPRRYLAM